MSHVLKIHKYLNHLCISFTEEIAKENAFLSELLNLEAAPNHQTARVGQEINPKTLLDLLSKKSIGKLEEYASFNFGIRSECLSIDVSIALAVMSDGI